MPKPTQKVPQLDLSAGIVEETPDDLSAGIVEDKAAPSSGDTRTFYQKLGPVGRAVSSFESNYGIPESVQEHPSEALTGIKAAILHPSLEIESLKNIYQNLNAQQQALIDRAYSLQHMSGAGSKAKGFVLGIYSALPVVGPAIVNALDQWSSGDKAGAVGSFAALATQVKGATKARVAEIGEQGAARMGETPGISRSTLMVRRLAGAGPEETTVKLGEKYLDDAFKAKDNQQRSNAAAARATERKVQQAAEKVSERRAEIAERQSEHQKAVAKQQAKHTSAVEKATKQNETRQNTIQQKETLTRQVDEQSAALGNQIEELEKAVNEEGDRQFKAVRAKIGNPEADPQPLIDAVKNAEHTILQDIPENLKEFRRILSMEAEDAETLTGNGVEFTPADPGFETMRKAYVEAGILQEGEKLTWDKAQALKSRLDARLRNGRTRPMDGNLKRALYAVQSAVVDEMGKMAEGAGQREAWTDARNFWRQYREDFHEPTGPSGSGSPIAKALDAVDPKRIRAPFIDVQSTLGNRGINTLRKYAQFGGDRAATTAEGLMRGHESLRGLEKPPKEAELPTPPAPIEPPNLRKLQKPVRVDAKQPVTHKVPTAPTVGDVKAEIAKRAESKSGEMGQLRRYDAMVLAASALAPFFGRWKAMFAGPAAVLIEKTMANMLRRPSVIENLQRLTPAEYQVLDRLPEMVKNGVREDIRKAIQQEQSRKVNTKVPERLQGFLNAGVATAKKPGGEQVKDLRAIQEKYGSNPAIPQGNNIE